MARDRKSDSHRTAAARHLGRPIKPGHDIDHLNENKADNRPENLKETPHGSHSSTTQSKGRKSLRALQAALDILRGTGKKSY